MTDTAIYMILDGSGSMSGTKNEVVTGVNEFIKEQQDETAKQGTTTLLSLTSFDTNVHQVYIEEDISLIQPVTLSDTFHGGGTALLDAIGRTLTKAEDNGIGRNLVVIYTDGEENQSSEFSKDDIEKLIGKLDKTGQWQFIYLGAEFGEFTTDVGYGAVASGAAASTSSVNTGKQHTNAVFKNVSSTTSNYRLYSPLRMTELANEPGGLIATATADGVDWDLVKDEEEDDKKKKVKNGTGK